MFPQGTLKASQHSMTLLTNEHCRRIESEGKKVIRFGFGVRHRLNVQAGGHGGRSLGWHHSACPYLLIRIQAVGQR